MDYGSKRWSADENWKWHGLRKVTVGRNLII